jgi:uncharacterized protein YcbX
VKGTRVHVVDALELDQRGAVNDRRFFLIDARGEMVTAKRLGALPSVIASCDNGALTFQFADGSRVRGEVVAGDPITVPFYGHPRRVRLVEGPFSAALSDHCGAALRLVEAGRAVDRGRRGAVSVISTASLERLAREGEAESVDARRFRMMIELEGPEAHEEDTWVGREARVGGVRVRFNGHVGRCMITTRHPETGEVDFPVLKLLGGYRRELPTTEPVAFGIYGEVLEGGTVRVGDELALL